MTLSDLQAAVYDECNYNASPAAGIVTRVTRFLNEGLRAILAEPGLSRLVDSDSPYTFASVASQARYVVPEAVARIHAITERTNNLSLGAMSLEDYRRMEPNPASVTGTPERYVPIGRVAVAVQPSAADKVYVLSTAAGDTGTAYVEGVTTGGYTRTASVSMTGVTAVQVGSIADFIEITDFYISANAVGTVTLLQTNGTGTELARITIGAKRPRYYGFYLWPTPSAAVTYYVDYRRELLELANATDEPPLPTDFHPMLVAYAVAREFEKTNDLDRAIKIDQRYQRFLSRLKYAVQTPDELPVIGRRGLIGHSRLGAYFPADFWR